MFVGLFKYLIIWLLFILIFVLLWMLLFVFECSMKCWDGFVVMFCVISVMVVFLYWCLFFVDLMFVISDGILGDWWLEYFLYGVGLFFFWIEVLFFYKLFCKWVVVIVWMFGVIVSFVIWMELVL